MGVLRYCAVCFFWFPLLLRSFMLWGRWYCCIGRVIIELGNGNGDSGWMVDEDGCVPLRWIAVTCGVREQEN